VVRVSNTWPMPTPPGWFPDPHGGVALRYWDGVRWTDRTAIPVGVAPQPREPFRTIPSQAAVIMLAATAVSLIADKYIVNFLVRYRWPIAAYVVIAAIVGYLPLVLTSRALLNRFGSGNVRDDIGLRFRTVDLGWGPVTWMASLGAQIVVAVIILTLKIPLVSNTEGVSKLSGNRTYIIAFAVLAVLVAPIVEEIVFRGVILHALCSRLPPWLAIGLQGVLFGAAHIDPVRGVGNIGLVMVLAAVGIVLGGAAYLTRRLAPTMIAHALINTLAVVLTLTR